MKTPPWRITSDASERGDADYLEQRLIDLAEEPAPPCALVIEVSGSVLPPDLRGKAFHEDRWERALSLVASASCPVVAVIPDGAVGPAWELALMCDFRIAAEPVRVGFEPGRVTPRTALFRLANLVGHSQLLLAAAEPVALSREVQRVHRSVISVVPGDALETATSLLVEALQANAPLSAEFVKQLVWRGLHLRRGEALLTEHDLAVLLMASLDRHEGMAAWRARREPSYRGI